MRRSDTRGPPDELATGVVERQEPTALTVTGRWPLALRTVLENRRVLP
jgi:hypothetical protein